MKLRNKKTEEIVDLCDGSINTDIAGENIIIVFSSMHPGIYQESKYTSLSELNEEWEDYKPADPLIKDEKIRKAVRAWAEANGIKEIIIFDNCNNAPYTPVGAVEFAGNANRLKVLFRTGERFDTNRIYTIEELCGEEEE